MSCIPSLKRVYDSVYAHYGVQAMSDSSGGKSVMGPTTPTEHIVHPRLLAKMVSAVDDFIAEPSREGIRHWDEIIKSYSSDNMPPGEVRWFDKLEESHGDISSVFKSLCEHLGLPDEDDCGSDSD
ncbi:hypothetical protein PENSPDRAFT_133398 [Peniophora sp. CONT]|nr:hypothetical protein PENSPDRAFT_133398 [Peniophora sp. CONT]